MKIFGNSASYQSAWFMLIGLLLLWTTTSYFAESDSQFRSEILIRHVWIMLILTAPLGWAAVLVVGGAFQLFGWAPSLALEALLVTVVLGLVGYLQWWVVLPKIWRCLGAWRARGVVLEKREVSRGGSR